MHSDERDQLARLAHQGALASNHMHGGYAELRIDLDVCEEVAREHEEPAEEMVEPAARAADDEDPLRLEPKGRKQRQLKIGRVLL